MCGWWGMAYQAEGLAEVGRKEQLYARTAVGCSICPLWREHTGRVRILQGDQGGLGQSRVQVRGKDA